MENNTLYIFDMDDTLLKVPKLADFVDIENGQIKTTYEQIDKYIDRVKGFFLSIFSKELCFEKGSDCIIILDCRTGKPIGAKYLDFIQDLTPERLASVGIKNSTKNDLSKVIEQEDDKLVLKSFPGFYSIKETIGHEKNKDVYSAHKLAKNKMVISGRSEKLRPDIEEKFEIIGIEKPNFGLHLFPGGSKTIAEFKTNTIADSIVNNGWEEIHFFEDKKEWLDKAYNEITQKFPEINFIKHLILTYSPL